MARFRKHRVAELLLSCLGEAVLRLPDPRVSFVTLTGVDMSPDLKRARVFWSLLAEPHGMGWDTRKELEGGAAARFPTNDEVTDVERVLNDYKREFKRKVADSLRLRYTPEIVFCYDNSLANGAKIDSLLAQSQTGKT